MTSDKSRTDEEGVLEPEWTRAWGQLRAAGYSESEIWDMAASVEESTWPEDPPPGKEKEHYYARLINHILNLRDRVLNEDQPPSVWIEAGVYADILRSLAGENDQAKDDLSERQRLISSGVKNRPTIGKTVVKHVLALAPPDQKSYGFFERYVGADRILEIGGLEIGVIAVSNEKGTVSKFGFELPGAKEPAWYRQASIRSIISRLNTRKATG